MPKVEVKLFIEESDLARAEKALCVNEGLEPINGANAKLALVKVVKRLVLNEERAAAAFTPPIVE